MEAKRVDLGVGGVCCFKVFVFYVERKSGTKEGERQMGRKNEGSKREI